MLLHSVQQGQMRSPRRTGIAAHLKTTTAATLARCKGAIESGCECSVANRHECLVTWLPMNHRSGRHFLQVPGPTNIPDRILRAMGRPAIDHRGPEFAVVTRRVLEGLHLVLGGAERVFIFPSSGSGGWEAALVNTLSPGEDVLLLDNGFFAAGWGEVAARLGLRVETAKQHWRHPIDPAWLEQRLRADTASAIVAVLVVHNETSTGVTNDIASLRKAIDLADHPALFMVDAVSSLASIDYRQDDWGIDVVVAGSQKGLMLPPGLGFNAVSTKALHAHSRATLPRSYWDWTIMESSNRDGFFPYTPATSLLYGLDEALQMLVEEGLPAVFARHERLAEATRAAVAGWGLDNYCLDPTGYSAAVTAVLVPEEVDADVLREKILERFNLSLGAGLGQIKGRVFRIGHLGDMNDLMLAGALCGLEMGLAAMGLRGRGGVAGALASLLGKGL